MLAKVRSFWLRSFESDKIAFYFELVSFIFTVGASLTLAITAADPDMTIIYPAFFIGAITQCYASYRRESGIRNDDHWLLRNHKCLRLRRSKLLVVR